MTGSYAVRFVSVNKKSGNNNAVLALDRLRLIDHLPAVVCLVRPEGLDFMLMNSTFVKCITHSAHALRPDNIRGSFTLSNIQRTIDGTSNQPEAFFNLFEIHRSRSWEENIDRIVSATALIKRRGRRFEPTPAERRLILEAPSRAARLVKSEEFERKVRKYEQLAQSNRRGILAEARLHMNDAKVRGERIASLLGHNGGHDVYDLREANDDGSVLGVDIKTKIRSKRSARPKGINIDKALAFLAEPRTTLAFLFVLIDLDAGVVRTTLMPVLDNAIIDSTEIRPHWAGRDSRGSTQLKARIEEAIDPERHPTISLRRAEDFLLGLVDLTGKAT